MAQQSRIYILVNNTTECRRGSIGHQSLIRYRQCVTALRTHASFSKYHASWMYWNSKSVLQVDVSPVLLSQTCEIVCNTVSICANSILSII